MSIDFWIGLAAGGLFGGCVGAVLMGMQAASARAVRQEEDMMRKIREWGEK